MDVSKKYGRAYFMPPEITYDWVKKDIIEQMIALSKKGMPFLFLIRFREKPMKVLFALLSIT